MRCIATISFRVLIFELRFQVFYVQFKLNRFAYIIMHLCLAGVGANRLQWE